MTKSYVTRQQARPYVQKKHPFRTSNGQLYALWPTPNIYVVYSYGEHWPLFVWDAAASRWLENEDRHSSTTTTRHRSYAHPHTATQLRSRVWLRQFIDDEKTRHREQLAATRLPLWYVRWQNFDHRKRINLIEPAYSDDVREGVGVGYAFIRAADEMGAYVATTTKQKKKAA